jgi:SAM-dependent methyltransferase
VAGGPILLNIGAGQTRIPQCVNVDIAPYADVTVDVGTQPLPFEDDSVDLVFSYATLEHIPNYLFALGEIHRVLKHGAPLLVGLPYVSLTEYHLVNPYHHHNFNEFSFNFFEPGKLRGSAAEQVGEARPLKFAIVFNRMHYVGSFGRMPEFARRWCRRHLLNVVRLIDFGVLAWKDGPRPTGPTPAELKKTFDELLAARVKYDHAGRLG